MIVTEHFVYIHTSRTAGTFLNKLVLEHVPGAQMIQYHGHLKDLPGRFSHLPVIGFVRNPWDWYVSMFCDYRRKRQYVFQIISDGGALDFEATVCRFLNLGDDSDESKRLLDRLVATAPRVINARNPAPRHLPGLRSEHFANFPENHGYYSWLFQLMFESENTPRIHIGRFEDLREEALRLFELTGASDRSRDNARSGRGAVALRYRSSDPAGNLPDEQCANTSRKELRGSSHQSSRECGRSGDS